MIPFTNGQGLPTRGTLILAITTKHGVAADSRGTNPASDEMTKIFNCGLTSFMAVTGHLVIRAEQRTRSGKAQCQGMLNTVEILREIAVTYTGDGGDDLANRIKDGMYRRLRPFWELLIEPSPEVFLAGCGGAAFFCEVPIVSLIANRVSILVVRFPFSPEGQLLAPVVDQRFIGSLGRTEEVISWGVAPEYKGIDYQPDSPAEVLKTISAIYEQTVAAHPDTVGGPVDIGFIGETGAEWLARKPGAQDLQQP